MKIRNINSGAEISSPYLVKEVTTLKDKVQECFIDRHSCIFPLFVNDGWEEVKGVDYAQLEKMADDALVNETKESLLAFLESRVDKQSTKEVKGDNSIIDGLKNYLDTTPKEKIKKDFEELEIYNSSSIEEAATEYYNSLFKKMVEPNLNPNSKDAGAIGCSLLFVKSTFTDAAFWMRESYLKESGWDKVFENLQKAVWHDLQKNPKDLPVETNFDSSDAVIASFADGTSIPACYDYLSDTWKNVSMSFDIDAIVIAWCDLPLFKGNKK